MFTVVTVIAVDTVFALVDMGVTEDSREFCMVRASVVDVTVTELR